MQTSMHRRPAGRSAPLSTRARVLPIVAAVGVLSVVGSLTMTPEPAHAATDAVATIAASVRSDTVPEDIVSGRISVQDQVAANAGAHTTPVSASTKADITRDAQREVADLKTASGSAGTGAAADRSIFTKIKNAFKHWGSVTIDTGIALGVSAGLAGFWGTLVVVFAFMGAVASAIVFAALSSATGTLAALAAWCNINEQHHMYVSVPDLQHSTRLP